MIWLPNEKYPENHFADELARICRKQSRETRRMAYVASAAVAVMVLTQLTYIIGL